MSNLLSASALLAALNRLEAEATGGAPVCFAVADRAGDTAAFLRMDGTPERAVALAKNKAYTSFRMGCTTAAFHDRLLREQLFLADFCDPRFTTLAGGVPILDGQGACIGGIGISGRKPEDDAALALRMADILMHMA